VVTTVQKWGNSLAIRIPKAFAAQARLEENTNVQISLEGDRIVVTHARREWTLEELVTKISRSNKHSEVNWGHPAGKEHW